MLIATILMAALVIGLLAWGYVRGQGEHLLGLKAAVVMTLQVLPPLIFAFIVAGMVTAMIPQERTDRWVGARSGWRGILIGGLAGALTPADRTSACPSPQG